MSKIEPIKDIKKLNKIYKYCIEVNYAGERNKLMVDILQHDPEADFKIIDRWEFKVKTTLPSTTINRIIIYSNCNSIKCKKCLFF